MAKKHEMNIFILNRLATQGLGLLRTVTLGQGVAAFPVHFQSKKSEGAIMALQIHALILLLYFSPYKTHLLIRRTYFRDVKQGEKII